MRSARFLSLIALLLLVACSNGTTHTAPPSSPPPIQPTITPSTIAPSPLPVTPRAHAAAQDAATATPLIATDTPTPPAAAPSPPSPTVTAQPFAPTLTQLTNGGCCRNPVWHPDSTRVLYTDAAPNQPLTATWAVPADASGPPTVFFPSAATVSPDGSRIAFPDFANHVTRIQEFGKQSTATIGNNAAYVWFSQDGRQVAWLALAPGAQPSSNVDRLVRVWVANADGANARQRGPTVRAADVTWFPDGQRLLFTGRDTDGGNPGIYVLDITTGALTRIVNAFSLRAARLSPDGTQIVYLATLEANPDDNGLFIVNADGSAKRKLPLVGGLRWSPDSKSLLMLPAPDGTRIVFNALTDSTIYVLRFSL